MEQNFFSGHTGLSRPFARYAGALLLSVVFYLFVSVLLIRAEMNWVTPHLTEAQKELHEFVLFVFVRPLIGFVGVILACRLILKSKIAELVNAGHRIRVKKVLAFACVWILLLTAKEFIYVAGGYSKITFNASVAEARYTGYFLFMLVFVIVAIPFQAFVEEIIYRSMGALTAARIHNRKWFAILFTMLLFFLVHGGDHFYYWSVVGIALGLLFIKDEGIELTWAIHLGNNFFYNAFMGMPSGSASLPDPALFFRYTQVPMMYNKIAESMFLCLMVAFIFYVKKWSLKKEDLVGKCY